jgi:hypothetical protein
MSEIEKIRQLDDDRPLGELAVGGVTAVVVNQVEIAQRVMNDIKADVGAHLTRICIVLNEGVEECARREGV